MPIDYKRSVSENNKRIVMTEWHDSIAEGYPMTGGTKVTVRQEGGPGQEVLVLTIHDAVVDRDIEVRLSADATPEDVRQACYRAFGDNQISNNGTTH